MNAIAQSVGTSGVNRESDVRTVQTLINKHARELGLAALSVDGKIGERTIAAIKLFQTRVAHLTVADGRVDPGGKTWHSLNQEKGGASAANLSGAAWWHANQARYPNSAAVSDQDPAFGSKVKLFLAAMQTAHIDVKVRSTRRNKVRAYLMHFSWKLAKGNVRAADIPAEAGCSILWDHGSDAKSRSSAQEMVNLFQIVYQPALNSRHILGLAIDMDIKWTGSVKIRDAAGKDVPLSPPTDESNTKLQAVGAGYGVKKNVPDRPHWSDNGH